MSRNSSIRMRVILPGLLCCFFLTEMPARGAEFLGVPVGDKLAQVEVSADGRMAKASLPVMADKDVIIVVTGSFIYSGRRRPPGEQDAKYRFRGRFGYGSDKVCLPCDDKRNARLSFQIDGDYHEPVKEDSASHTYVYRWKVPANGEVTFKIADEDYADNSGGLEASIFKLP